MNVLTAAGKIIEESEITHQHWSNIYWYNSVFSRFTEFEHGRDRMIETATLALDKLKEKFGGELLDWKPMYRFETEMLLSADPAIVRIEVCDIIVDGEKVGKILEEPLGNF